MGYRELVERKFDVIAEECFGDYQGEIVFLVKGDGLGVIITGYGSCSSCDAYEDAAWDGNSGRLDELADQLHNSVRYGTVEELREFLTGDDACLQWYYHETGFSEAIDRLFASA